MVRATLSDRSTPRAEKPAAVAIVAAWRSSTGPRRQAARRAAPARRPFGAPPRPSATERAAAIRPATTSLGSDPARAMSADGADAGHLGPDVDPVAEGS